ncbi:Hypothetical protein A7982_00719 [Minicystis rosea]|nr:Hypothetical protein A7982_00719 [Minicystis rosea]
MLPVALEVTEPVAFSSPAGRTVFDLRAGSLAYVHGAGGSIEWLRVGDDIGDDKLRVYGTKAAAEQLAQRLAGRVEGGGDGRFTIVATDVFERASFMKVPEGIKEIAPERALGVHAIDTSAVEKLSVLTTTSFADLGTEGMRQAVLVGVYRAGPSAIVLDAEGGYTMEDACSGNVTLRGRYRTEGERVMLESDSLSLPFTWEGGSLLDAGGMRYAPLIVPDVAAEATEATGGEL